MGCLHRAFQPPLPEALAHPTGHALSSNPTMPVLFLEGPFKPAEAAQRAQQEVGSEAHMSCQEIFGVQLALLWSRVPWEGSAGTGEGGAFRHSSQQCS